jgi:hypothetical protein
MPWTRGEPLTVAHRSRLVNSGVLPEVLDDLTLRNVTGPLPEWWHEYGNALYLRDGMTVPSALIEVMATYPFRDVLIVLGTGMEWFSSLLVGGDGATVFIGPNTYMTAADLYCATKASSRPAAPSSMRATVARSSASPTSSGRRTSTSSPTTCTVSRTSRPARASTRTARTCASAATSGSGAT